MKKQLITLFCLLCSVAFISCEDDDEKPTPAPAGSGLRTGSTFTFTRSTFDVTGTNITQTEDYTITFVQDTTINGEEWMIAIIADPQGTQYALMRATDVGLYSFVDGNTAMDLKFNPDANDTWTNSGGETVQVKAVDETVTVPVGSFGNTIYVETSDANSMESKIWYNEHEFMLKHEEFDEDPVNPGNMVLDYRDELKSVKL